MKNWSRRRHTNQAGEVIKILQTRYSKLYNGFKYNVHIMIVKSKILFYHNEGLTNVMEHRIKLHELHTRICEKVEIRFYRSIDVLYRSYLRIISDISRSIDSTLSEMKSVIDELLE